MKYFKCKVIDKEFDVIEYAFEGSDHRHELTFVVYLIGMSAYMSVGEMKLFTNYKSIHL